MDSKLNVQKLVQMYSQFERVGLDITGLEKFETNRIVKFLSNGQYGSFISWFHLISDQANDQILAEIDFFTQRKKSFEWKVYSTDSPDNIGELLIKNGFTKGEKESFMMFDMNFADSKFPVIADRCTKVTTEAGINDAIAVQSEVWNRDFSDFQANLITQCQSSPESISIYVVYEDNKPVSSAWIVYTKGSPFAGVWGGSTLKAYRERGYYTSLLTTRVHEAKAKGIKYLTIDASDMSRPLVEKLGFQYVSCTTPYEYHHG